MGHADPAPAQRGEPAGAELGGLAADILVRRINGASPRPRRHTLRTAYIDRESTGPVPAPVRRLRAPQS
ncbi:hypothetical protein AB0N14_34775 [Streptomyces sp. NPDC051104]|uniref:hypothetical protein n=1 Tax=Streptomyces sp. NPDC051104 TaxID=3155044 RepID=UPI003422E115